MNVEAHRMRGIDPFRKRIEEENEFELFQKRLLLSFQLSGLINARV
jgi:hypothetical protein